MKYYEKDGRVFNAYHKEMGNLNSKGYLRFAVSNGRKDVTNWSVHRWIWTQYNGPIPKGYDVDHINYNKTDNRIQNLQLISKEDHRKRRDNTGYIRERSGKYQATRDHVHLGTFATKARAIMACALFKIT